MRVKVISAFTIDCLANGETQSKFYIAYLSLSFYIQLL